MKIAIITDGIYPFVIGGMQKHSFYLAKFLVKRGVDVTLIHCVTKGELPTHEGVLEAMELEESANFKSIALRFPQMGSMPGHYIRENYAYSMEVFKSLEAELQSFDLIYAKGFAAWALLDKKRKGLKAPPVAVKFHGYEMFQKAPSFRVRLEHYLLRGPVKFNNVNADYIFSYGGKITSLVEGLGISKDRIKEIPTGIEANWCRDMIAPIESEKRRFLFIGRYERRKGIEELNEVLNAVDPSLPFHFDFVGPIPPSKQLKDDRITYHGKVMEREKLQAIMENCEVLVTPSHSEGMPNVIMEGMARGLAVIATDVGAVAAQVDNKCGWLLEPANVPQLKAAFEEAVNSSNEDLIQKRKNALTKVKEHFTWEHVSMLTQKAFEEIG